MAELIYLDANTWRYENAGTADSLIISGTTLTDLPASQSKTGTAFYQTAFAKCFDLPSTNEVWFKFDVYYDGSDEWYAYNCDGVKVSGATSFDAQELDLVAGGENDYAVAEETDVLVAEQLQTVLLHMVSGTADGVVEAWVDGSLISSYTGAVNRGLSFEDLFLQSDGSGTFFSNVIISNAEIGLDETLAEEDGSDYSATIKPEIYISWIPRGQLEIKPLIFASILPERFIPVAEKISVDTARLIKNAEKSAADLSLKITQDEKFSADLLRHVIDSESACADLKRKIALAEKVFADTFLRGVQADKTHADTFRRVKDFQRAIADTSRKMGIAIEHADLQRIVKVTTSGSFDTCRKIGGSEKFSADIRLTIGDGQPAEADTIRRVNDFQRVIADTIIKDGVHEKFSADTSRALACHEKTPADTFRQVAVSEKIYADVLLRMRDFSRADTHRKITRSEKTIARTVIRIPHIFNYFIRPRQLLSSKLRSDNSNSLVNTFKQYGVTAINITLAEKTLSDDFRFDIVEPVNIQDTIELKLLDYEFSWIVEETTQRDLVQSVRGKYSVDDLLYTWFTVKTKDDDAGEFDETAEDGGGYFTAGQIIKETGKKLGFSEDNIFINIDDFTPSNIEDGSLLTYSDLLSNLFGWTSRVPQRQINVFIRGKKLYCIQRGKEENSFDITNLPHSRPTINRKFNRVLCYNPNKTDGNGDDDDDDDNKRKFSGTIAYSTLTSFVSYTYAAGLLVKEQMSIKSTAEDGKLVEHQTSTSYSYTSHLEIKESSEEKSETTTTYYIQSKSNHTIAKEIEDNTTTITETTDTTDYHYKTVGDNELYLFAEYEKSVTKEYEKAEPLDFSSHNDDITEINIRETHHVPLGNGFYAQTVFINGQPQGANISQGKPGGAVSPYTVDQVQGIFNSSVTVENAPEEVTPDTDELSLIVDDSFPVRESAFKDKLNEDLRALHRKIIETVSVDLISKIDNGVPEINHIVDFTETITLDRKIYFLVSNNISFTPRKLIQKLQLIRWE